MRLAIFDLDGTLFDTKDTNFSSYKEALKNYGFDLNYDYFCKFCNGRYYLDFLPNISTTNKEILENIHKLKKDLYHLYLDKSIPNKHLFNIIELIKKDYKIAIVTTASYKNTLDILNAFNVKEKFDLVITKEDVKETKPNPEGFFKAMEYFNSNPEETIIFEDSEVGLQAAELTKATVIKVNSFYHM